MFRNKKQMTDKYMKLVCNSIFIIQSTHEKAIFTFVFQFLFKKLVPNLCFYSGCIVELIER